MKFQLYPLYIIFLSLESAYLTGHSTESALLMVHNEILLSMDKQTGTAEEGEKWEG